MIQYSSFYKSLIIFLSLYNIAFIISTLHPSLHDNLNILTRNYWTRMYRKDTRMSGPEEPLDSCQRRHHLQLHLCHYLQDRPMLLLEIPPIVWAALVLLWAHSAQPPSFQLHFPYDYSRFSSTVLQEFQGQYMKIDFQRKEEQSHRNPSQKRKNKGIQLKRTL